MRTMKGLLALAALALALMGFASSAMAATDGVIRDVDTNEIIPENHELHAIGWARFSGGGGSVKCHVTSIIKAVGTTGTTGNVTNFSVPGTLCTYEGGLAFCKLVKDETLNLPYHATVTPPSASIPAGDIDVTGAITLTDEFTGTFCPLAGGHTTLTFSAITLTPLGTGERVVTNTAGRLGTTAVFGEGMAGIELSGSGTLDKPGGGTEAITASGELELTEPDISTWYIASS